MRATPAVVVSPIINSPFDEPARHWYIEVGQPPHTRPGRRRACYWYRIPEHAGRGRKTSRQSSLPIDSQVGECEDLGLVNLIRERLQDWRTGRLSNGRPYDGATPVTRELLELWHSSDRRQRLFFAQREAAETVIFLSEAPPAYRRGIDVPKDPPSAAALAAGQRAFTRYACKMATGSGKTTVMGMLAAWSILNRLADPGNGRYSDTVLVVCPNVTIRERLKELDPALGDLSLYRTRQLVPPQRMEDLRRGEVMLLNWHRLAKQETGNVNGDSARVVKTGEPVEIVRNAGKAGETREIRYFESDRAWFERIRREFGNGRGRSPQWLVFNDEAHHAYRRGEAPGNGDAAAETALDDDRDLAKKNAREATVWIEGLDRIHRYAAGGRRKGIGLCVDLSATPFYLQGSGNEVGRPFPWIVSDFGLLDAIESGLVKIPQLPSADVSGADESAYFNVWRWIEERAAEDGHGTQLTPHLVMRYVGAPITLLASQWQELFREWQASDRDRQRTPVPPVFIVICRDTAVARVVHRWLADNEGGYGEAPEGFRNRPGQEVTVRIDSKVVEDIEAGGTRDETRRLRFILDTIGRTGWPGGKVPEEWSELVRRHNAKLADDETPDDGAPAQWLDERVPPGRDVRCIVSVAMLTEGWDASTVTHIVGLRPFGSQLLCEQVIGRALRRKHYTTGDDGLFAEETAKVFGVPFQIVPFKTAQRRREIDERPVHHIHSMPEKAGFEIRFPIVTGYHDTGRYEVEIDWQSIAPVTIDPMEIPDSVQLSSLTAPDGALAAWSVGDKPTLDLNPWRARFRDQQVAFRLAREVCLRWREDHGKDAVPMHVLFPKVLAASRRFLTEKLRCEGSSTLRDVQWVGDYMQAAIHQLCEALHRGSRQHSRELPVIAQGSAGIGSTVNVDFHTIKPIRPAGKCHLNAAVADTARWEQSAAYCLDTHPGVLRWVRNDRLGLQIPYRREGIARHYLPDFVAVLDTDVQLLVEIKGQADDRDALKATAAERWAAAVNRLGEFGQWQYLYVDGNPARLSALLDERCRSARDEPFALE